MDNILLVSSSEKNQLALSSLLKSGTTSKISLSSNGSEARRIVTRNDFDTVIITAPLMDEFGHDLSISVTENSSAGVILIVKNEIADDISSKVEPFGVMVVPKPLNRAFFYQVLRLVSASRSRIVGLQNQNQKLLTKIEEIRTVDRAKCLLIEHFKMTEEQAHHYIEKQAMDTRKTKRDIAENILKTYEI